jgi:hypothetical protein
VDALIDHRGPCRGDPLSQKEGLDAKVV